MQILFMRYLLEALLQVVLIVPFAIIPINKKLRIIM
jgi:hypothetical protein